MGRLSNSHIAKHWLRCLRLFLGHVILSLGVRGQSTQRFLCEGANRVCGINPLVSMSLAPAGGLAFAHGGRSNLTFVPDASIVEVINTTSLHSETRLLGDPMGILQNSTNNMRYAQTSLPWRSNMLLVGGVVPLKQSSTFITFSSSIQAFSLSSFEIFPVATYYTESSAGPAITDAVLQGEVLHMLVFETLGQSVTWSVYIRSMDLSSFALGQEPIMLSAGNYLHNISLGTVPLADPANQLYWGLPKYSNVKALGANALLVLYFQTDGYWTITAGNAYAATVDIKTGKVSPLTVEYSPPFNVSTNSTLQAAQLKQGPRGLALLAWTNGTVGARVNQSMLLLYDAAVNTTTLKVTLRHVWVQALDDLVASGSLPSALDLALHGLVPVARLDLHHMPDFGYPYFNYEDLNVQRTGAPPTMSMPFTGIVQFVETGFGIVVRGQAKPFSDASAPVLPFLMQLNYSSNELLAVAPYAPDAEANWLQVKSSLRAGANADAYVFRDASNDTTHNEHALIMSTGMDFTDFVHLLDAGTYPLLYLDPTHADIVTTEAVPGPIKFHVSSGVTRCVLSRGGRNTLLAYGGHVQEFEFAPMSAGATLGNAWATDIGTGVENPQVLPLANQYGGWGHSPGARSLAAMASTPDGAAFIFGGLGHGLTNSGLLGDLHVLGLGGLPADVQIAAANCSSVVTVRLLPGAAVLNATSTVKYYVGITNADKIASLDSDVTFAGSNSPLWYQTNVQLDSKGMYNVITDAPVSAVEVLDAAGRKQRLTAVPNYGTHTTGMMDFMTGAFISYDITSAWSFAWGGCNPLPAATATGPTPTGAAALRLWSAPVKVANASAPAPQPRTMHTMAYMPASALEGVAPKGALLVFGGQSIQTTITGCGSRSIEGYFADLWMYDIAAAAWTELAPEGDEAPEPRVFAVSAVIEDQMIIWGGKAPDLYADDCYYPPAVHVLDFVAGRPSWRKIMVAGLNPDALKDTGKSHLMPFPSLGEMLLAFGTDSLTDYAVSLAYTALPRRLHVLDHADLAPDVHSLRDGDKVVLGRALGTKTVVKEPVALLSHLHVQGLQAVGGTNATQQRTPEQSMSVDCAGQPAVFKYRPVGANISFLSLANCNGSAVIAATAANSSVPSTVLPLSLSYMTFRVNSGKQGSAVRAPEGGAVLIDHSLFRDNFAGPAVYGNNAALISIADSLFTNNTGGCLRLNVTPLAVADSMFDSNSVADENGAAVNVLGASTMSLTNVTFVRNVASHAGGSYGGAIYIGNGMVASLSSVNATANAADNGGALAVDRGACLEVLNGSSLAGNTATLNGGALYSTTPSCSGNWTQVAFSANRAGNLGGGAHVSKATDLTPTHVNVSYTDNEASEGGGLFFGGWNTTLAMSGNNFTSNSVSSTSRAAQGGGASLQLVGSTVTLNNSVLVNNTAWRGGGIAVTGQDGQLAVRSATVFQSNSARSMGGGIFMDQYTLLALNDSQLAANEAVTLGGALVCSLCSGVTCSNSSLSGNSAAFGGGAAVLRPQLGTGLDMASCNFTGNKAQDSDTSGTSGTGVSLSSIDDMGSNAAPPVTNGSVTLASVLAEDSSPGASRFPGGGGGGLYMELRTPAVIRLGNVEGNLAPTGGGVLGINDCSECKVTMSGVVFHNNDATTRAGPDFLLTSATSAVVSCLSGQQFQGMACPEWDSPPANEGSGATTAATYLEYRMTNNSLAMVDSSWPTSSGDPIPVTVNILDAWRQLISADVPDSRLSVVASLVGLTDQQAAETLLKVSTVEATGGAAVFDGLSLLGKPGRYSIQFQTSVVGNPVAPVAMNVTVRDCYVGEYVPPGLTPVRCLACASPRYSFDRVNCSACPSHAVCDGSVVYPISNYWQSSPRSTQIHQCLWPSACTRTPEQVEAMVSFQVENRNVLNVTDMNTTAYAELLCSVGYEGNLCGNCQEGYGRGSGYKCVKCMSYSASVTLYVLSVLYMAILVVLSMSMHMSSTLRNAYQRPKVGGLESLAEDADDHGAEPSPFSKDRKEQRYRPDIIETRDGPVLANGGDIHPVPALDLALDLKQQQHKGGDVGDVATLAAALCGSDSAYSGESSANAAPLLGADDMKSADQVQPAAAPQAGGTAAPPPAASWSDGNGQEPRWPTAAESATMPMQMSDSVPVPLDLSDSAFVPMQTSESVPLQPSWSAAAPPVLGPGPVAESKEYTQVDMRPAANGDSDDVAVQEDQARGFFARMFRGARPASLEADGDAPPLARSASSMFAQTSNSFITSARSATSHSRLWRFLAEEPPEDRSPLVASVMKVFITYLQTLGLLRFVKLDWPVILHGFVIYSDQTAPSTAWVSLDCTLPHTGSQGVWRTTTSVLLPVAGILFAWLAWALRGLLAPKWPVRALPSEKAENASWLVTRIILSMVLVLFFYYPTLVAAIVSIFSCSKIDSLDGVPEADQQWLLAVGTYWNQDTSMLCWQGAHYYLALGLGVPAAVVFALGIPFGTAALLYGNRKKLFTKHYIKLRYGFLYENYRPSRYYWECVVLLRKLAVVLMVTVLTTYGAGVQLMATMAVLFASLALHVSQSPFPSKMLDVLERGELYTLIVTVFTMTWLTMDISLGNENIVYAVVIIVALINCGMIFMFLVCFFRELKNSVHKFLSQHRDKISTRSIQTKMGSMLRKPMSHIRGISMRPSGGKGEVAQPSSQTP